MQITNNMFCHICIIIRSLSQIKQNHNKTQDKTCCYYRHTQNKMYCRTLWSCQASSLNIITRFLYFLCSCAPIAASIPGKYKTTKQKTNQMNILTYMSTTAHELKIITILKFVVIELAISIFFQTFFCLSTFCTIENTSTKLTEWLQQGHFSNILLFLCCSMWKLLARMKIYLRAQDCSI